MKRRTSPYDRRRAGLPCRRAAAWLCLLAAVVLCRCSGVPAEAGDTGTEARIFPEYYRLTLPPNIAPLNFRILEPATAYRVKVTGSGGDTWMRRQRSPLVSFPVDEWHRILSGSAGGTVAWEILAKQGGSWRRFNRIEHRVSADTIDSFLVYRLVHAVYLLWRDMGIYQRNLTNFDESPLTENFSTGHGCMNCHSFAAKDPSRMLLHFRILHPGTLIWKEGELSVADTRRPYTLSGGVYPSWHPGGKHIAFSVGKLSPHLTTRLGKTVDVADKASDLMVYDLERDSVISSPAVSTGRRENMPAWSADGRTLYFISAPEAVRGDEESLLHSRYDLMRSGFDAESGSLGEAEPVLGSDETGMSVSMPSVSPAGRLMTCSMSDYGYFTIFHQNSDLYLIDLEKETFRKLELNSDHAESYSTWSSNGRWLVFSSKRLDGVMTRPYIAHIDSQGVAGRPFLLPQKDPSLYSRLTANFNRPELVKSRVKLRPVQIRDRILAVE